jgi:hypothetical protein
MLADRPVGIVGLLHLSRHPVDRPNATETLRWPRQQVDAFRR